MKILVENCDLFFRNKGFVFNLIILLVLHMKVRWRGTGGWEPGRTGGWERAGSTRIGGGKRYLYDGGK